MTMKKIALVSLNDQVPWGGSEVLWSEVGKRLLTSEQYEVAISPREWAPIPESISDLLQAGAVDFRRKPIQSLSLVKKALIRFFPNRLHSIAFSDRFQALTKYRPDLVVLSLGDHNAGADWMAKCREFKVPYFLIVQLVKEGYYPPSDDDNFRALREGYRHAKFVLCSSFDNLFLLEKQFARSMHNALIVNNPVQEVAVIPPYPQNQVSQLAMVASLDPNHKGHDILFDVLRADKWRERPLQVNLYGSGRHEKMLRMLVAYWGLKNVSFHGHRAIEEIWKTNQLLIMPTRMEGLSLAFLEAANCERPAIISRVGDAERFVDDEISGFLIKAPQADMLDEAMERAWVRRSEWEAMGKRARLKLKQEITEDSVSKVVNLVNDFCQ